MEALFSPQYQWLWTTALAVALFVPVRHLIWIMSVRRAERLHGSTDDAKRGSLKRRAAFTAALLCFIFAVLYMQVMTESLYGGP